MSDRSRAVVALHQCLFGYEDGHKLLYSSVRLPPDAEALLLLQSDLRPGLISADQRGYFTGIPLSSAKCYALMRTWPAPEMSRPGCVWTHAILIKFSDIARFESLGALTDLFSRPPFGFYTTPLEIDPKILSVPTTFNATESGYLNGLRAVYGSGKKGILRGESGACEPVIFSVWSQQWPRLRRTFSFSSASVAVDTSSSTSRFDLRVLSALDSKSKDFDSQFPIEDWEAAALTDLSSPVGTEFRRFLWRYGSDIRRGRERFSFLARLFVSTRVSHFGDSLLELTFDEVARVLPDQQEGMLLKEDLVSCGQANFSLLPAGDPFDTISYVARHSDVGVFPEPPSDAFASLGDFWPARAAQILSIVDDAGSHRSSLGQEILSRVSGTADPADFLKLTAGHPRARRALIELNPALLDSTGLDQISAPELAGLISLLPEDQKLAERVLNRLLYLENMDVSKFFSLRHPELTLESVAGALSRELKGGSESVPFSWLEAIRKHSGNLLPQHLLLSASDTTQLAACAILLRLDVQDGLRASSAAWATILGKVTDNVSGAARTRLLAYLLALALAAPMRGCEPIFERAFEAIHKDIAAGRLPDDAYSSLTRHLPDISWWNQWDTCLRLRMAIVNAYVSGSLDIDSFRRLTSNDHLHEQLVSELKESKQGRAFLRNLGR